MRQRTEVSHPFEGNLAKKSILGDVGIDVGHIVVK